MRKFLLMKYAQPFDNIGVKQYRMPCFTPMSINGFILWTFRQWWFWCSIQWNIANYILSENVEEWPLQNVETVEATCKISPLPRQILSSAAPFWKSTDFSSTVESVKKNAARSPVFPVPAAGRWNKKGASLHVAILDVIAVPGFFRMCSGGFGTLLPWKTSIIRTAANQHN